MPGVGADHEDDATAPDDLALFTHPTDASADLHGRTRDNGQGWPGTGTGTWNGTSNRATNYKFAAGGSQGGGENPAIHTNSGAPPSQLASAGSLNWLEPLPRSWRGGEHHRPVLRDRHGVLEMGTGPAVHGRLSPIIGEGPNLL